MEDAISVTVIATGFNADGKPIKKNDDNVLTDDKNTTEDEDDDDDTFYDIMSIFNK
jgi:cell division protein FtsZ